MWAALAILGVAQASAWASPITVAPVSFTGAGRPLQTLSTRPWHVVLLERAREHGLRTLGGELAGPDRSAEARLVLASEVRQAAHRQSQGKGKEAPEAWHVEVWWQLVDRRQDEVLWEGASAGDAAHPDDALLGALDGALGTSALRAALARASAVGPDQARAGRVVRSCETPAVLSHSVVTVGRGGDAGVGVVVSPDGLVWTSVDALPPPLEPIRVRTAFGTVVGRWVYADAALGLALLHIPLGDRVGCAPRSRRLPIVRDLVAAYTGHRTMTEARVRGFLLERAPARIVVDPGEHAAILDTDGGLIGFRVAGSSHVVLHEVLASEMGLEWSSTTEADVIPAGGFLERSDPLFQAPPER